MFIVATVAHSMLYCVHLNVCITVSLVHWEGLATRDYITVLLPGKQSGHSYRPYNVNVIIVEYTNTVRSNLPIAKPLDISGDLIFLYTVARLFQ